MKPTKQRKGGPVESVCSAQVRLHGIMDGSSLAHAIHVPMGPLPKLVENPLSRGGHTHTHTHVKFRERRGRA